MDNFNKLNESIDELEKLTKEHLGDDYNAGKTMVDFYISKFINTYFLPIVISIYIIAHLGYMAIFGYYMNVLTVDILENYNMIYSAVCIAIFIFYLFRVAKLEKKYKTAADKFGKDKVFNICCNIMKEIKDMKNTIVMDMLFLTFISYLFSYLKLK